MIRRKNINFTNGVIEMIPLLKRCTASFGWTAVCLSVACILAPIDVDAQSPSSSLRTASPQKARAPAKAVARNASPWVANPGVNSRDSYLIVDASSGREIAADRPDELRYPASITKLMTLYLTFSALDSGRLSLGDNLAVSANAMNVQPTKMGVVAGSTVSVRDAAMGLVTRSANDAAVVLAEALGGDEDTFARQMTQKAHQLGMSSTVFRNASGLPNREQVTTARDLTKLAQALLRDFPHYYPVFSVQSFFYRGRPLENHNRMLASYAGSDGLKTGYTAASGFNLVMSAMRDNRRLIGVVMGGDSAFSRDRQMADLMDRGFASAPSMGISPWTSPRQPPSARYTAAQFSPGVSMPEPPRPAPQVAKAEPPPAPTPATPIATAGSWVIQIGSFGDPQAAQLALERASSALRDAIRTNGAATVDEVQMAQKTFHRARLTSLSQQDAIEGCKRLEQRKIYCSALQVTAWNTPGVR